MRRKHPFVVGSIYHIYNRGVAKNPICEEEIDYWRFLQGLCLFNDTKSANRVLWELKHRRGELNLRVLRDYVVDPVNERNKLVRILAYCVMGNHYHLLLEEVRKDGITKFMQKFGTGYGKFFNKKYDRVGHLFQDRFKSILIGDDLYLQYLLIYINVLNPISFIAPKWREQGVPSTKKVLGYVKKYPWSSHQDYLGLRNSIILEKGILSTLLPTPKHYISLVKMVLRDKRHRDINHLLLEKE